VHCGMIADGQYITMYYLAILLPTNTFGNRIFILAEVKNTLVSISPSFQQTFLTVACTVAWAGKDL